MQSMPDEPMGFMSRGHRLQSEKHASADAPLCYTREAPQSRPNFAPFSTTTKRDMTHSSSAAPPPGLYELRTNADKEATPAIAGFRSKTIRFVPSKDSNNPGPGEYGLRSYTNPGHPKQRPMPTENKLLQGLSQSLRSAPSIPNRFQASGYETDGGGKLKPQKPLKPGFSGLQGDQVGPGDYEPATFIKKNASVAAFSRMSGRSEAGGRGGDMPGPGYYNIQEASNNAVGEPFYDDGNYMLKLNESKKRQLSSFASGTQREAPVPKDKLNPYLPGPGTYQIPSSFGKSLPKSTTVQCFSTSDLRFRDSVPRSQRLQTSPGTYNPITSDFELNRIKIMKQKRASGRSGWAQNISFDATEARFMMLDKRLAPPPGTYDPKTGLSDALPRENARGGPFGSKSKRFDFEKGSSSPDDGGPSSFPVGGLSLSAGGGNQSPGGIGAGRADSPPRRVPSDYGAVVTPAQGNTAIFTSKTNRFAINKHDIPESPPPGTYNTAPSWYTARGVVPLAPSRNESILRALPAGPGPGDYELAGETAHDRNKRKNRKNVLVSTSQRFETDAKSTNRYIYGVNKKGSGPGPQDYNPQGGSMLKASYNALMNPDMFD
jgi:hypothetical protein